MIGRLAFAALVLCAACAGPHQQTTEVRAAWRARWVCHYWRDGPWYDTDCTRTADAPPVNYDPRDEH